MAEQPVAPAPAPAPAAIPPTGPSGESAPDEASEPGLAPAGRPRRTVTQKLRRVVRAAVAVQRRSDGTIRRPIAVPLLALRVLVQVLRQWARDRCPQQAASLAFQTTLSLVPLIAAGLALLRASGAFEAESSLVKFLSTQVIPVSRAEIAGYLVSWAGKMDFRTAGIAGLLTTLVLSFFLFASVEDIFNDIWRAERRRSLAQKAVTFYALVTIVPALMGISLYHAARYGLTTGVAGALGSLASVWGALFCANKLLPATRVSTRAAALGALVSALAFEAAKFAFQLYVAKVAFQAYAGVYGTLGLVPILLIWIYYAWLVILFGAEVAHTLQNLQQLERLDFRGAQPLDREIYDKVNGTVAARLMVAVVAEFMHGGKGVTRAALASRFALSEIVVERVFRRLKEHGLALEVAGDAEGYLPARPPSQITLADVLLVFRGSDALATSPTGERTRLDLVIGDLNEKVRDRARGVTFEDLARDG